MTNYNFQDRPLKILCSSRIRLDDKQRLTLRQAYTDALVNGVKLGMNDVTLRDLLGSRDSINAPVVLELQYLLGCEVLTREQLEEAYQSYLNYIFSKTYDTDNS